MCKVSEKDVRLFVSMLDRDKHSLHFLWDCNTGTVVTVGCPLFDDVKEDPLDFLRESGLIDPESMPAFNVFSSRIEEGVISGIDRNSLSVEINMKFAPDEEYSDCGFYAHFLRDDAGKITAVHGTIRPYSKKELFERRVLKEFSSEQSPKIFDDAVAAMMARHKNEEIAFIQFDVERFKLINEKYGEGTAKLTVRQQYRNLRELIGEHMEIVELAERALRREGIEPVTAPVRGGTDGSQLTFRGLLCPNIGTGGYSCHGPYEHITAEHLETSANIVLNIIDENLK